MINLVYNKRSSANNSLFLIWLPVFVLPLINLLVAFFLKLNLDFRIQDIIAAIFEELFFRLFLLKIQAKPSEKSILWISCLFSLFHLFNYENETMEDLTFQVIFAFCFSIWAGMVVYKTGNIAISIFAHIFVNLSASGSTMIASFFMCVITFLCGTLLIINKRNKEIFI